jgi:hypothetical protein
MDSMAMRHHWSFGCSNRPHVRDACFPVLIVMLDPLVNGGGGSLAIVLAQNRE